MSDESDAALADRLDWADWGLALDISVNLVPVVILLGFSVLFIAVRPWRTRLASTCSCTF